MKGIAFILSLVILFISVSPCSDEHPHEDTAQQELSSSHDHEDNCLSICVCSCCGTTITFESQPTYELAFQERIGTHLNTNYTSNYRFDFGTKLWHPPRSIS